MVRKRTSNSDGHAESVSSRVSPGESDSKTDASRLELPKSCTSMPINYVGVVGLFAGLFASRWFTDLSLEWLVLFALFGYALPIALLELIVLKTHRRSSTGLDYSRAKNSIQFKRVFIKLLGLWGTIGAIAAIYSLFPEYTGGFYARYWSFLAKMAPFFVVGSLVYFALVDRLMVQPEDGFWYSGLFLLGRFGAIEWPVFAQHALAWLVKFFFLPLMFIYALDFLKGFIEFDFSQWLNFSANNESFSYIVSIFFGVDVFIVTVGYFCTLRVLDTHCRSTEPTAAGWLWALVCYEPIWSFVYGAYLNYNSDGVEWWHWLSNSPILAGIWGAAIGVLSLIYVLSSVAFGLRFSNLTNRGILTNGMYRYCKHPAYVSKNLSWWLISIPFIAHPQATAYSMIHDSVLLLALNGIYFLRARTEERHLGCDPTYVQYALAMNEKSVLAWMGRCVPALRYQPGPVLVDIKP